MTVVQSYVCGELYVTTPPKFDSLPANVGEVLVQAISYNTASTSLVMVRAKLGNKTRSTSLMVSFSAWNATRGAGDAAGEQNRVRPAGLRAGHGSELRRSEGTTPRGKVHHRLYLQLSAQVHEHGHPQTRRRRWIPPLHEGSVGNRAPKVGTKLDKKNVHNFIFHNFVCKIGR